jgi:hypothetical protein
MRSPKVAGSGGIAYIKTCCGVHGCIDMRSVIDLHTFTGLRKGCWRKVCGNVTLKMHSLWEGLWGCSISCMVFRDSNVSMYA